MVIGELRSILRFGSTDDESELMIAVSEIAHNAVSAQSVVTDRPIEIAVDGLPPTVSITDHAGGFVPPPSSTPPAVDSTSGRGLLLARAFVPAMEILATHDGTTVRLPMRDTTAYRIVPER